MEYQRTRGENELSDNLAGVSRFNPHKSSRSLALLLQPPYLLQSFESCWRSRNEICPYLMNWASTDIDLLTYERSLTKTGTLKCRVTLVILAIGLKCVNSMMTGVAMETGQNLPSAPLHSKNTLWHSIIAAKLSIEFWKRTVDLRRLLNPRVHY